MISGAGDRAGVCFGLRLLAALWLGWASSAAAQVIDPGTVVQTIDTSAWSPPSPDPSGITYRPDTEELLTCDSEVNETVIFTGTNLWTHSSIGVVTGTASTTSFSNEPTGVAWDPAGGRLWIGDDIVDRIFEIDFGTDGIWNTGDDLVFVLDEYEDHGCADIEDVAYDNLRNQLIAAAGAPSALCRILPGANGFFDGAPPAGDDVVLLLDVGSQGISDPEGVVYDPFWDTLIVADRGSRDLWELDSDGNVLRRIDVNFPGTAKISGVTIAPSSLNPMLRDYWVTDRAVDNNSDPLENDGRIYEVVAIPLGGNGPPVVDAGASQTVVWPADSASLDGFVSDDGHPFPPSTVTALWSVQSGTGSVTFTDDTDPTTLATFSTPGQYVLQLAADDSALQAADTVTIDVVEQFGLTTEVLGAGSLDIDPAGSPYPGGTVVTLTALPAANWRFAAWSGDASGSSNPLPIVMNAETHVTAVFQKIGGGGGGTGCGIGPELAAALPFLLWLHARRRRDA